MAAGYAANVRSPSFLWGSGEPGVYRVSYPSSRRSICLLGLPSKCNVRMNQTASHAGRRNGYRPPLRVQQNDEGKIKSLMP